MSGNLDGDVSVKECRLVILPLPRNLPFACHSVGQESVASNVSQTDKENVRRTSRLLRCL